MFYKTGWDIFSQDQGQHFHIQSCSWVGADDRKVFSAEQNAWHTSSQGPPFDCKGSIDFWNILFIYISDGRLFRVPGCWILASIFSHYNYAAFIYSEPW